MYGFFRGGGERSEGRKHTGEWHDVIAKFWKCNVCIRSELTAYLNHRTGANGEKLLFFILLLSGSQSFTVR